MQHRRGREERKREPFCRLSLFSMSASALLPWPSASKRQRSSRTRGFNGESVPWKGNERVP